jgi:hypothetical protein
VDEFHFRKESLRRQRVSPRRRLYASERNRRASLANTVKRITAWFVSSQVVGFILLAVCKI